MKILDLDNIRIIGKNRKYILGRGRRQLVLSPEYREFVATIANHVRASFASVQFYGLLNAGKVWYPPYIVRIDYSMAHDIDAPVQATLDAMVRAGVIEDDKHINQLHVFKHDRKRGAPGRIEIYLEGV